MQLTMAHSIGVRADHQNADWRCRRSHSRFCDGPAVSDYRTITFQLICLQARFASDGHRSLGPSGAAKHPGRSVVPNLGRIGSIPDSPDPDRAIAHSARRRSGSDDDTAKETRRVLGESRELPRSGRSKYSSMHRMHLETSRCRGLRPGLRLKRPWRAAIPGSQGILPVSKDSGDGARLSSLVGLLGVRTPIVVEAMRGRSDLRPVLDDAVGVLFV